MSDEAGQCRQKAEACRQLAEISEDESRKLVWLERADYWAQLARKASNLPPRDKA
jgi:hypothetical protein